ncbi:GntR family transcriptional regulator [Ancylobacter terrae]|uniref:GntR family transcriptional regulator n=1 Tax=Ancylobacter sp. sgz301288 TaxID=3342077 RepID=UPI003859BDCB
MSESALNKRWQNGDLGLTIERLPAKQSFKSRAYAALKEAITGMDIYGSDAPLLLDERDLSERLGASRTPIREAVAMLEQEGLLRAVPRRGILVVRRTKVEIIEMIEAWAALESMAARLATQRASDEAIAELRAYFKEFDFKRIERERCDEYSSANIAFHQALIRLSGSRLLAAMTENLFLHVRAIRHRTIFEMDRAQRSAADHLEIIEALEARDADRAERLVRDHTLRLAAHVRSHVDLD